jgi:metallo-beta-lactamase family protein
VTVAIKFCGAAGTVTGSCYLVAHPHGRLLIDCGLFQGPKTLRELNYGAFPFDPRQLDAVLVTHAHVDHSGLLPKLYTQGYAGRIYATAETNALLEWMLPDSGAIQEGEVQRLNRRNARRGRTPVEPIYTRADAEACLKQLAPVQRDSWIEIAPGVRARYRDAGHILGACSIELEIATDDPKQRLLRILFAGDIGPDQTAFYSGPQGTENFDYVVVESTYGDRDRPRVTADGRRKALKTEVLAALKAGGNLIMPAFAVERTQELLSDLCGLMAKREIPAVPVFLDSPLAIRATEVFEHYRRDLQIPDDLPDPFHAPNIRYVTSAEQSMALSRVSGGAILMAASGMCDAGRIRYHLKNNLWRSDATVLFTGFQAAGTMGALLQRGVKSVRIHGEEIRVAARIRSLDVYSGHADRKQLLAWVAARLPIRRSVFVTHGEEAALLALKDGIVELDIPASRVIIPRLDQTFVLHPAAAAREDARATEPRLSGDAATAIREGRDWHNDYASFILDLQGALGTIADDRGRRTLLRRLKRSLGGEPD